MGDHWRAGYDSWKCTEPDCDGGSAYCDQCNSPLGRRGGDSCEDGVLCAACYRETFCEACGRRLDKGKCPKCDARPALGTRTTLIREGQETWHCQTMRAAANLGEVDGQAMAVVLEQLDQAGRAALRHLLATATALGDPWVMDARLRDLLAAVDKEER